MLVIVFNGCSLQRNISNKHCKYWKKNLPVNHKDDGAVSSNSKQSDYINAKVIIDNDIDLIFVCGLATADVLNKYQDIDLILDPNLRNRGTKTGFYGFKYLQPLTNIGDIEKYKK